jgi:hypothetical protein
MTNSFTEEELAALPSTSTIFDRPTLEFDSHDWVQQGYTLTDTCNPHTSACEPAGIPIPSGKLLIKKDGRYDLIDEKR